MSDNREIARALLTRIDRDCNACMSDDEIASHAELIAIALSEARGSLWRLIADEATVERVARAIATVCYPHLAGSIARGETPPTMEWPNGRGFNDMARAALAALDKARET